MPTVNVIPCKRGMSLEEIYGRLQSGWVLLGRQTVQRGTTIATPDDPGGSRLEDNDVWVMHEPMIPLGMVAQLLLKAMAVADGDSLEYLSRELFGMDLLGVQQALLEAANAQEQHPSKD